MSDILFEKIAGQAGDLGLITLNRPQALNALSHEMIIKMYQQLIHWRGDTEVKAIVIQGSGEKAFCAGGDIRKVYDAKNDESLAMKQFFWDEYRLNSLIHHYSKPYIALLNGITMGGGGGVSLHGSHRVATEKFLFAMPETGIGFFPDIGGSYFLPRCKGQMGIYLGLTGARIKAAEALYLNLVNHFVGAEKLSELISVLAASDLGKDPCQKVTEILTEFSTQSPDSSLAELQNEVDDCFDKNSIEAILERLEKSDNADCQGMVKTILSKSPTSLKVTLEQLHRGKNLDFNACMQMEYRLMIRFLQGHDFYEGVRAVIVDKDQKPQWNPSTLNGVTSQAVAHYFAPLEGMAELSM